MFRTEPWSKWNMKNEYKIVMLAVAFFVFVCVSDALLDNLLFHERTFWESLVTNVPHHDIYHRSLTTISFLIFGLIAANILAKQKQVEEKLRREAEINLALAELYVPMLSGAKSVGEIAQIVLEKAKSLTNSEHGYVSEIDPETEDNVAHTLTAMLDECTLQAEARIVFPCGSEGNYPGLLGHCLNSREAFFTNSPASHFASRGTPQGHLKIQRFLSVPVFLGDHLVGQIALANPPRDYTEQDLDVIKRLAVFYALAIQNKRAEKALMESEKRFRTLFENASDAIYLIDIEGDNPGKIVAANNAAAEMHDYTIDEILQMNIQDLDTLESAKLVKERCRLLLEGKRIKDEAVHRRKDGSIFPIEINATLLELNNHKYGFAIDRDITERKIAERKIIEQNEFLNGLLEAVTHPFYVVDATDYSIVMANSATRKAFPSDSKTCYGITHHRNSPCDSTELPCPLEVMKKTKNL